MGLPIIRVMTLAALGWLLYRSRGPLERSSEGPQRERRDQDSAARPEASVAEHPSAIVDTEPAVTPEPDDLTRVRGIGPAIARHLNAARITTWMQLAAAEVSDLRAILEAAGPRYRVHDPEPWPELAAELAGAN